jgi:glycosyltransferase involved in cell wall biosynthesis
MEKMKLKIIESNLGNSGSFVSALELAVKLPPDDMVYFVEDDYIHKADAVKVLAEAIPFADYVTVYDHPDKYGPYYDGGEVSKVFRTKSSHWRFTQSTTMTFAAQVKTLQEDLEYYCKGHRDRRRTITARSPDLEKSEGEQLQ